MKAALLVAVFAFASSVFAQDRPTHIGEYTFGYSSDDAPFFDRIYIPKLGRWVELDPIFPEANLSEKTHNKYYVVMCKLWTEESARTGKPIPKMCAGSIGYIGYSSGGLWGTGTASAATLGNVGSQLGTCDASAPITTPCIGYSYMPPAPQMFAPPLSESERQTRIAACQANCNRVASALSVACTITARYDWPAGVACSAGIAQGRDYCLTSMCTIP